MILANAFSLTSILGPCAIIAYVVSAAGASRVGFPVARVAVRVAWILHGILLASSLFGETPRFGFAPALSMTAWLVAAVYAIESQVYPLLQTRWTLSMLGALAVLLSLLFPGSELRGNSSIWLPFHLALGIASYGFFGVAVVHAWFMNRAEGHLRLATDAHAGMPLLTMERLTFRFVAAGFILLSATLLTAIFFGNQLYGSTTRLKWDHKAVFSVLSWLTFAGLLIGRGFFGWRGKRAVRVLYMGSGFLLLAYVGSRFVLEVILRRPA